MKEEEIKEEIKEEEKKRIKIILIISINYKMRRYILL